MKSNEFIASQENGWYWRAKNEIYPLIQQVKEKLKPEQLTPFRSTLSIFERIEKILYSDVEAFKSEYECLLPKITEENVSRVVVFSHNDTQENNFLYRRRGQNIDTKIIDFEYSQPNYRGADIASYVNECSINYKVKEVPFYEADAE